MHNINRPAVLPYSNLPFADYYLPFRHSVQLGLYGKIGNVKINLFGSAEFQDSFYQLAQVLQVKAKHLLVGIGYQTNNTLLSRLGIVYDHFRIIYGYDITISQLSNASSGSHEFALQVLLNFKQTNPNPISY